MLGDEFVRELNKSNKNVYAILLEMLPAIIATRPLTRKRANMLEDLSKEITTARGEYILRYRLTFEKELERMAVLEFDANKKQFDKIPLYEPVEEQENKSALILLLLGMAAFNGQTLDQWFSGFSQADTKRIMQTATLGINSGLIPDRIARSIVGTKALGYKDGVVSASINSAAMLARTVTSGVSNGARKLWAETTGSKLRRMSKKNASILLEIFSAVLDSRTTFLCASLSGNVYRVGEGYFPPLHPNACKEGTLITTSNGLVPIELVKVGDYVLTHMNRYKKVTAVMCKPSDTPFVKLVDNFGASISLSNDHPVLSMLKGWIKSGDIEVGDIFFKNTAKLDRSKYTSIPKITQAVLIDSHNKKTKLVEELISYGIYSGTAGVSSSIKLKKYLSESEISNIFTTYNRLKDMFNVIFMKESTKKKLMNSRIICVCNAFRNSHLFNNTIHVNRVVGLHSLGRKLAGSFVCFWIKLRPVFITGWLNNVFCISPDGIDPTPCRKSVFGGELPKGVIAHSGRSFDPPETFVVRPMIKRNKTDPVHKHSTTHSHNTTSKLIVSREWHSSTCMSTVEFKEDCFVYNLSVDEDETYIANGILVHNCRSTRYPIPYELAYPNSLKVDGVDFGKNARRRIGGKKWGEMDAAQHSAEVLAEKTRWLEKNVGVLPEKMDFEPWFGKQSTTFQRDYLGKNRYARWESGDLDIGTFVAPDGARYTIQELVEKGVL